MTYTPAKLADMLEAVKLTPPSPQRSLSGGLSMLDEMTVDYMFDHGDRERLRVAHYAFSTARLDLQRASATGTNESEAWIKLIAAADAFAAELRHGAEE